MDIVLIVVLLITTGLYSIDTVDDSTTSRIAALFIGWSTIIIAGIALLEKFIGVILNGKIT